MSSVVCYRLQVLLDCKQVNLSFNRKENALLVLQIGTP